MANVNCHGECRGECHGKVVEAAYSFVIHIKFKLVIADLSLHSKTQLPSSYAP